MISRRILSKGPIFETLLRPSLLKSATTLTSFAERIITLFSDRVSAQLGADVDNIFNHPLLSPNADAGGGGGTFAWLGSFILRVDQTNGKLLPLDPADVTPNPDFGRLISSFTQEGIDNRRTVRLRLRITF